MRITKIGVHASAGFNHPSERFSNYKPGVNLEAVLDEEEGSDPARVHELTRALQTRAQDLVESQKTAILEACRRAEEEPDNFGGVPTLMAHED
jgi:hypothetical protein